MNNTLSEEGWAVTAEEELWVWMMGLFGALALSVKAVGGSNGWPKDKQLERETHTGRLIEKKISGFFYTNINVLLFIIQFSIYLIYPLTVQLYIYIYIYIIHLTVSHILSLFLCFPLWIKSHVNKECSRIMGVQCEQYNPEQPHHLRPRNSTIRTKGYRVQASQRATSPALFLLFHMCVCVCVWVNQCSCARLSTAIMSFLEDCQMWNLFSSFAPLKLKVYFVLKPLENSC